MYQQGFTLIDGLGTPPPQARDTKQNTCGMSYSLKDDASPTSESKVNDSNYLLKRCDYSAGGDLRRFNTIRDLLVTARGGSAAVPQISHLNNGIWMGSPIITSPWLHHSACRSGLLCRFVLDACIPETDVHPYAMDNR